MGFYPFFDVVRKGKTGKRGLLSEEKLMPRVSQRADTGQTRQVVGSGGGEAEKGSVKGKRRGIL